MEVNQQTFSVPFQAYLPRFHVLIVRVKAVILIPVYFANIGFFFENVEHWTFEPLETLVFLFVKLVAVMHLKRKGMAC